MATHIPGLSSLSVWPNVAVGMATFGGRFVKSLVGPFAPILEVIEILNHVVPMELVLEPGMMKTNQQVGKSN